MQIWLLQLIKLYQRRKKSTSLKTQLNFWTHIFVQTTHINKVAEFNIAGQIWYNYFGYTGRLFLECALFVARYDIIRAWETKKERLSYRKKYLEEFLWGTLIFWLHTPFSISFFVAFIVYFLPLPKWRACWMAPIKIHSIVMVHIFCDDIINERSKISQSFEN